jgi:hypothetical protein
VDSSVITLTQTTTVTPGGVSFGWSQARRPNADIMDAIEDECSRRVSGFRGVMFLLLFQNLVSPTAGQTARANRLKQTLAFAENLKSQAATLTTITGANWP